MSVAAQIRHACRICGKGIIVARIIMIDSLRQRLNIALALIDTVPPHELDSIQRHIEDIQRDNDTGSMDEYVYEREECALLLFDSIRNLVNGQDRA